MDLISMNSYNVSNLLRIGGLATGLDTDSIVKQLMKVASLPLDKLNQQKQWYQWQQEDLRDINAKLMNLRNNVVASLRLQGTFMAKTVTSSNTSVATATAGANAVNGTYTLSVTQLATAAATASTDRIGAYYIDSDNKIQYNALNTTGSDITLKLRNKDGTTFSDIIIPKDANINNVISAINSASKSTGIVATYDQNLDRLFLVSNVTGSSSTIDFSATTDQTAQNFLTSVLKLPSDVLTSGKITGQDAIFTFNGVQITSSTNNVTVAGINVTLTGTTASGQNITLTVSTDVDKIYNTIKNFVDTYNDVITQMYTKLTEKRYYDYPPLTDEQKQAMKENDIKLWEEKARSGNLANDETLMRAYYSLRQAVSSTVSGVGSLSSIGITTGQWYEGGKLYIDEAKLKDAIANNLDKVMQIFTGVYSSDGTTLLSPGIAQQLYGYFENGTFKEGVLGTAINAITRKAGSSTQLYDNSFIGNRIREIDDRIAEMQKRLKDLEDRYYRQFTQLEIFVGQMNTQSAWLNQQIGIMTK
ncbi:flagellar hook protein FliD [Caldanaerobacter subterraneus subsp. yonseiensis KB-1]|uniref:Flagellar hook-associated protein 2 n=1 Tax=Caldanaerobacter subterraneus subsp. yonseiensis KB-1 TaxID=1388761 RepID=U5CS33_CALSX|nr:flagellar filament capping protein FliD [Caldanaerobacter subterraneus]ERM91766.1 flagellar hook protein FliD [Caldanaerobacter subterraneus subsp. yonseiensis KB-1]